MPLPLLVAVGYLVRLLRRPIDVRLKRARLGAITMLAGGVVLIIVWTHLWSTSLAPGYRWGELAGVGSVYLLSSSLLLATRLRGLEPYFGGLDRMYLWHKRAAILGALLIVPHKLITGTVPDPRAGQVGVLLGVLSALGLLAVVIMSLPRAGTILHLPYQRWLFLHRLSGVFVILAALHGLSIDLVTAASPILKTVFLLISAVGTASYVYSEILMRRRVPAADYTIAAVHRPAADILEIDLAPTGAGLDPRPGQFLFLSIGGDEAWREHPFSIAGTQPDGRLRLSVRALGVDTRRLHARLRPGLPAHVTGPYGMFDYTLGATHQAWIAGGIGVVPFLSWLTAPPPEDLYSIDLFYSVPTPADAIYLTELHAAAAHWPDVRIHPVFTRTNGRLTSLAVTAQLGAPAAQADVFLCGPLALVEDLSRGLRAAGVAKDRIHAEHFSFR